MWPLLRTDDLVGGFYVADEGRADPVGVAMSLARGARCQRCRHHRGRARHRGGHPGEAGGRGGHRAGDHRVRVRRALCRDVVAPVRSPRRRGRSPAGGRALLPDHRAHGRGAPRPPGHRGPRWLRLFPARRGRAAGRIVRARGRGVGPRRRAPGLLLRGATARRRPAGPVRGRGHAAGAVAVRHRHPEVLLWSRVVHVRCPPTARVRLRSWTTSSWPPVSTRWASCSGGESAR